MNFLILIGYFYLERQEVNTTNQSKNSTKFEDCKRRRSASRSVENISEIQFDYNGTDFQKDE